MEGDAFMNREIARPEIMPSGGASPPYRPLDEPGHDAPFAEPLDMAALQGILAAELEAQSPRAAAGEAHQQGENGGWVSSPTATGGGASPGPGTTPHASVCSIGSAASASPTEALPLSRQSYGSGALGSPSTQSPDVVSLRVHDDGTVSTAQAPPSVTSEPPADASTVLPADSLEAPSWRLEPEAVHPSIDLKRNFAWNPWTKTYVPLEQGLKIRRLWCYQPRNLSWWTAFLFLLGSVGFFYGAVWASLRTTHSHPALRLYHETLSYLAGGLCFVAGAVTLTMGSAQLIDWDSQRDDPAYQSLIKAKQYGFDESHTNAAAASSTPSSGTVPGAVCWLGTWEVAPAPGEGPLDQPVTLPRRESSGVRMLWRVSAEEEFQRLWAEHDPWTRRQHVVETMGSFIIFIGTLFYKVALFSDLFTQVFPDVKIPKGLQWYLLVGCLMAGSFAFVLGGYLLCAAYERSWVPWRLMAVNPLRANLSWWIVILNMAGSLLFMLGAIPLVTPAPELLSPSFVQNLLGWACGSFLFFVQSWLMVIEVATAEDNERPDDDDFALR